VPHFNSKKPQGGMMKRMMIAAVLFSVTAMAADSKVGYVDVQKAIQTTAAGKKAKEQLDGEFKKRKDSLDKKKADIEKMGQDLEKKRSVLSEEVLNKKQQELGEEMKKFQQVVAENQMEIQKKEKDLVDPILEKMKKVIEKVAQSKGFTIVIERTGQNVLFAQKDADLTDDVVSAYEKEK
jgi:outer membrane protein